MYPINIQYMYLSFYNNKKKCYYYYNHKNKNKYFLQFDYR